METMRYIVVASFLLSLGLAAQAQASSYTVEFDQPYYVVGDTLKLTITGDSQGDTDWLVGGRLYWTWC